MARLLKQVVCVLALGVSALSTQACVVRVRERPPPGYVYERRAPAPRVVYGAGCARRVYVSAYHDRFGGYHDGYWRCGY